VRKSRDFVIDAKYGSINNKYSVAVHVLIWKEFGLNHRQHTAMFSNVMIFMRIRLLKPQWSAAYRGESRSCQDQKKDKS
jgi:hypothetical protein